MDEQKRGEVAAFFWFVVSALTLLALLSYTPDDIAFEVSTPNSPSRNFVGVVGAHTAWLLMLALGKTSYFLVPLFLVWSLTNWAGRKAQKPWLKIFSTAIFFGSACALFSLLASPSDVARFDAGGITGFYLSSALTSLFGSAGIFVALSLFLLSIILATELLVLQAAAGIFKRSADALAPVIANAADRIAPEEAPAGKRPSKPEVLKTLSTVLPTKLKPAPEPKHKAIENARPAVKPEPPKAPEKPVLVPEKPQIRLNIPEPKPEAKLAAKTEPKPEPKPAVIEEGAPAAYTLPSMEILQTPPAMDQSKMKNSLEESSRVLEDTLRDFGIDAKVVEVEQGPTIARYELQPAAGVKVQRITSLENDIALAMRATSVRIIAPIPGKSRVGIEVPNTAASTVYIKEVLTSAEYQNERSKVPLAFGKDTAGTPLVANLADMPHLLIAGATNTGKSVCINSIIAGMLFRATPEELKFLMIDPKMVELHFYNELPHLICPVVTDKAKAPGALAWLVGEMERRYKLLSRVGAKNILGFNEKVEKKEIRPETLVPGTEDAAAEPIVVKKMPYIVLVIDELADLMLTSANEVETAITRLAQLARAVGIHMILATQRPSVDVITGVIKANFPARIAFQVASKVDSRTILDENGADKLLGRGDMLLMDPRKSKLIRAQGAWVQDAEIDKITSFIKNQRKPAYTENILGTAEKKGTFGEFRKDEVYEEAKRVVLETQQASVSMIQRRLGLGYTRAARLIDMMEEEGVVGPYRGAKPREILVPLPEKKSEGEA